MFRNKKSPFAGVYLPTLLCILMLATAGCDPNRIYEKNKPIPPEGWKSNQILKFNVDIPDTSAFYNYYINLRINSFYRYANLFLFMKTLYPNGQISVDTVECFVADVKGKWLGSRSGRIIDNRIPLWKKIKFPMSGVYSFEFEQAMRDTVLENVENFGIRIETAEP